MAVAVPLYFVHASTTVFEVHKAGLVRAGAAVAALAWLFTRVCVAHPTAEKPAPSLALRTRLDPLSLALGLFVGAEILATLTSVAPAVSLWGQSPRQQGLVTVLALVVLFATSRRALADQRTRQRLITAVILGSLPVCLYALLQKIGLDPWWWDRPMGGRAAATLGNPIFLGAYLAAVSLPTLGRSLAVARAASEAGAPLGRLGTGLWLGAQYGLLLVLQLFVLWMTGSRGPILAWGVGLVAFVLCVPRDVLGLRPLRMAAAIGLVVAGGLASGVLGTLAAGLATVSARLAEVALSARVWAAWALVAALGLRLLRVPARQAIAAWLSVTAMVLLLAFGLGVRVEPARPGDAETAESWMSELRSSAREPIERVATASERILYWRGYLAAFTSTEPLPRVPESPSEPGEPDPLWRLRPFVGFGPETTGAVFQHRGPREIAQRHGAGVTADRAHNLVWDRLVATGLLGLLTFSWLAVRILDRALGACGFEAARRPGRVELALLGGGVVGGAAGWLGFGPELLGVGIQVGVLLGVLGILAASRAAALARSRGRSADGAQAPRDLEAPVTAATTAAVVCLLAEWTVGFPVVTTQLLFWTFAALLVALTDPHSAPSASPEPAEPSPESRTTPLLVGLALGVVLFTLPPVFQVLAGLLLTTFLWGLAAGAATGAELRGRPVGILCGLGLAGAAVLCQVALRDWVASGWKTVTGAESWQRIADLAARDAHLVEVFHAWWLLAVAALAIFLARDARTGAQRSSLRRPGPVSIAALALASLTVAVVYRSASIGPARADVLTRVAALWSPRSALVRTPDPGSPVDQLEVSHALLRRSTAEAPFDERLLLLLAASSSARGRFPLAERSLEDARRLLPVDPMIVLAHGRVAQRWAWQSEREGDRRLHTRQARAWFARARDLLGPLSEIETPLRDLDALEARSSETTLQ